uniref:Fat storage inducing transmembrane protein 2 n=1 Tax=Lepisosteus oculatus TaxID=7918 RepID=W5M1Q2_LEPOC
AKMAALGDCVDRLVRLWGKAHHYLCYMFILISFTGSLIKEMQVLPDGFFSDRRNFLNVYFVKFAWGWTLFPLLPFIAISNYCCTRDVSFALRRLGALAVGTAVWYTCTRAFLYIEDLTGACYEPRPGGALRSAHASRPACRGAGHHWAGFDISGHSFLLAYSALLIGEEMVPMGHVRSGWASVPRLCGVLLGVLYLGLNVLVGVWVLMFACTAVYFHDAAQKLLGTAVGLLAWYLTYKLWYRQPFSPRLPPQPREHRAE